jgi:hypothetical protein
VSGGEFCLLLAMLILGTMFAYWLGTVQSTADRIEKKLDHLGRRTLKDWDEETKT